MTLRFVAYIGLAYFDSLHSHYTMHYVYIVHFFY